MSIDPETLFRWLIMIVTLLCLILGFIFVGIEGFALGGTFGAIINSIFPIAGGIGVSQHGNSKESILSSDNVNENCQTAVAINHTDSL